jgi:hypothetical protein
MVLLHAIVELHDLMLGKQGLGVGHQDRHWHKLCSTGVMVAVLTLMDEKQGRIGVPQDWCWRYVECLQLGLLILLA